MTLLRGEEISDPKAKRENRSVPLFILSVHGLVVRSFLSDSSPLLPPRDTPFVRVTFRFIALQSAIVPYHDNLFAPFSVCVSYLSVYREVLRGGKTSVF